jgi:hypothetical protein
MSDADFYALPAMEQVRYAMNTGSFAAAEPSAALLPGRLEYAAEQSCAV